MIASDTLFIAYISWSCAVLALMILAIARIEVKLRTMSPRGGIALRIRWKRFYLLSFLLFLIVLAVSAYFFFPSRLPRRSDLGADKKGAFVIINLDANAYMTKKQEDNPLASKAIKQALTILMLKDDGKPASGDYRVRWFKENEKGIVRDFQLSGKGNSWTPLQCYGAYVKKLSTFKNNSDAFTDTRYANMVNEGWAYASNYLSVLDQIEEAKAAATDREPKKIEADLFQITISMVPDFATALYRDNPPRKNNSWPDSTKTGYYNLTWVLLDKDGMLTPEVTKELKAFRKSIDEAEHPLELSAFDLRFDLDADEMRLMVLVLSAVCALALAGSVFLNGVKMKI